MADVKGGYAYPSSTTWITSSWNDHRNRPVPSSEPGTDYGCAYGSAIFAPEDGVVVDIKDTTSGGTGRYVTIDLGDGRRTRALHLSRILVSKGQRVKRGQEIAKSGASGFGKEWGYGAHVHQTLWEHQSYSFGKDATIDFQRSVGADNDGGGLKYDQATADIQASLNRYRGEKLVVDGLRGPATIAAIKRLQTFLGVGVDGIWGPITNTKYNEWVKKTHPPKPPNPQYHNVTLDDIASIGDVRGLQKIARLYLPQTVDNKWGPNSKTGLQRFLNANYGGSLTTWLRSKWGYVGNEQFGPQMKAALQRANAANLEQL